MLSAVTDRIARARTVANRATPTPLLIRCAIALCGVLTVVVAYPGSVVAGRYVLLPLLVVVVPAFLPRGRAATVAAVAVVAGWVLATTWYNQPVVLWRVLAVATGLYLAHTLTALAAVLPYDAVVQSDVITLWVGRAFAVVLGSAVLTVAALALTARLAGNPFLLASLVGLAAAVGVTALLARLLRRP
ncbi:MAG TPA: hypothetical protein VF657_12060 [Actinoplanes sp.]